MGSIISIITALIPTILRLVGMWIDKSSKDKEHEVKARDSYVKFVEAMEGSIADSAKLRKSIQKQKQRLDDLIKAKEALK